MAKKITIINFDRHEIHVDDLTLNKSAVFYGADEMEASDGYHTFDELYEHRMVIYIALCKMLSLSNADKSKALDETVWRSKNHSDGEPAFGGGWFVLGIGKEPGKQITYHLPLSKWDETNFAETLEQAPEFDGHSPDDVLQRLKNL